MSDLPGQKRIDYLVTQLRKASKAYYSKQEIISDEQWDNLYYELESLDPDNPALQEIGEGVDEEFEGFEKEAHRMFMHSQQKARNLEEFERWLKKLPERFKNFIVDHKLDGLSIELIYENGELVHALTQGEKTGFDICAHVKKMAHVPLRVKDPDGNPFEGSLRGEMIMSPIVFAEKYESEGYTIPRSTAVGLSKKNGPHLKDIQVILYDASLEAKTHSEVRSFLTSIPRAKVAESRKIPRSKLMERVTEWYQTLTDARTSDDPSERPELEIDGLVVKCDTISKADATRVKPNFQIAIKFPPQAKITQVLDIIWQQSGETYTPLAILKPITLCSTTIKRATLCNPSIMEELGIRIGSEVRVTKRNDIIPKVEEVINVGKNPKPKLPVKCFQCETKLVIAKNRKRLSCPNVACPALLPHRLKKWITTLDSKFFGDELILAFIREKSPSHVFEVYDIDPQEMAEWTLTGKRVGISTAKKALTNLRAASKQITVETFLGALDIRTIGPKVFGFLTQAGHDLLSLRDADVEILQEIKGISAIRAKYIVDGLAVLSDEIDGLIERAVTLKESEITSERKGSVCFTGALSQPRKVMEVLAYEGGYEIKSGVSKGLTYLVTPDANSGSAKNRKAQELGVKVIDEPTFRKLLE